MQELDSLVEEVIARLRAKSTPSVVKAGLDQIRKALEGRGDVLVGVVIRHMKNGLKGVVDANTVDLALAPPTSPEMAAILPWPDDRSSPTAVPLAALLNEMSASFTRHMVLPEGAANAAALWIAHTYVFDSFPMSPYLAVMSATRGCGKTTMFQVVGAYAHRAFSVTNASSATIFRIIQKWCPTLLLDEGDTYLRGNEELRGILDGGHAKISAMVMRCAGEEHEVTFFSTWAPKAFALIGRLPPTLEDRSIRILLKRKSNAQAVEPIESEDLAATSAVVRSGLLRWAEDKRSAPLARRPAMPAFLYNRTADNWRALMAIAEDAGEDWVDRARAAATMLNPSADEDEDIVTMLLRDLRDIFAKLGPELYSEEIVVALLADENRPWRELDRAGEITPTKLSALLKDFRIGSKKFRRDKAGVRDNRQGYKAEWFKDAFAAYFPESEQVEQMEQRVNEISEEESTEPTE